MDLDKRLAGHLGHLTPTQEKALTTFKNNLTEAGLYQPESETLKASHDDYTLLRFLRARRFDPAKAQKQFASAEAWRKKHDVASLYANFDTEEFELARTYYPRWTGRRDKDGIPLYVYKISALKPRYDELNAVPAERRYQRLIMLYEGMLHLVLPVCSDLPRPIEPTPVSSGTSIIDLADVSMGMLWNFRSHLQSASTMATANYPETLHHTLVVNSPSYFPTIWNWVKAWFDEVTQAKIKVFGKNPGKDLLEYVDAKNLPKCYGGELEWDFNDDPLLDDDAKNLIGEFPKGTWVYDDGKISKPREDGRRVKRGSSVGEETGKEETGKKQGEETGKEEHKEDSKEEIREETEKTEEEAKEEAKTDRKEETREETGAETKEETTPTQEGNVTAPAPVDRVAKDPSPDSTPAVEGPAKTDISKPDELSEGEGHARATTLEDQTVYKAPNDSIVSQQ